MQRYYATQSSYARLDDPAATTPPNRPASGIALDQYRATDRRGPLDDDAAAFDHRLSPSPPSDDDDSSDAFAVPRQQSGHHQNAFPQDSSYEPYRHDPTTQPRSASGYHPHDPQPALQFNPAQRSQASRSRRRRLIIIWGSAAGGLLVLLALAVGLGVGLTRSGTYSYVPSTARVTAVEAFDQGGATHNSPNDTADGVGAGQDVYTYYSGEAANFPNHTTWVSFEDMWTNNLETLQTSCETLKEGSNNSPAIIQSIYDAIQNRANASAVDHRFIFAVILQESKGCVHVKTTTSTSGVSNPGLMQSHAGASYSAAHSNASIWAMVQDGTQGTSAGDGLVQNLNLYHNPYRAARGYNSGYIPASGNLSEAAGATACYVSDVANRLTGWVWADSTCPGDTS